MKEKIKSRILIVLFFTIFMNQNLFSGDNDLIVFDEPAAYFTESSPIGNGRLGAMVFGGNKKERIVLNENSLWSGSPQDADRADGWKHLSEIQSLLLEGKNAQAQELVLDSFSCKGLGSGHGKGANVPFGCYQVFGNLTLDWVKSRRVSNYSRYLDLENAISFESYKQKGEIVSKEYFVSAVDQLLVIKIRTNSNNPLALRVSLDRPERAKVNSDGNNRLIMQGALSDGKGGDGMHFASVLDIITDGSVISKGKNLLISNSTNIEIRVAMATDFMGFAGRKTSDPLSAVKNDLELAKGLDYKQLKERHINEYKSFYDRASLSLGKNPLPKDSTFKRIKKYNNGANDPAMAELYFNFGRYLLISSSRPGTLPANLQGLWSEEIQTPWNGDYHLDINVQMNYWPAEIANLSELHLPLIELIKSLEENGAKTAKNYYKAKGWVAHVITNIWGYTSPGEHASWGSTSSGSAWLCSHLWEHYAFNPDKEYLKTIYPVLKGASEFYSDFLIEMPNTSWLVTAPSNSPENQFIKNGKSLSTCLSPTIDNQVIRELFTNTLKAAQILNKDVDFQKTLKEQKSRLVPTQIGKQGQIMEWIEDYKENEPTHRHVSHLYGLYPSNQITTDQPQLFEAAKKTLELRGDLGTGWSLAWKINFWARLRDGNKALELFRNLLKPNKKKGIVMGGGGTYSNLFCAHPPFQIDGNFGGAAGIVEMLIQSHNERIDLLPALPDEWKNGEFKGLKARGGITVDLQWVDGLVTKVTLSSAVNTQIKVHSPNALSYKNLKASDINVTIKSGIPVVLTGI